MLPCLEKLCKIEEFYIVQNNLSNFTSSRTNSINCLFYQTFIINSQLALILLKRRISHMSQPQQFNILSQTRTNKNIQPTSQELEFQLSQKMSQMNDCEKIGNYVKAQRCKQNIQNLKKQLHQKRLQDMTLKHKRQKRKQQKSQQQEVVQLNQLWNKKIEEFNSEGERMKREMDLRHESQIDTTKTQLQSQISNKMKQSSECLNFRKVQEQMAKQKKYGQAHQIQQIIVQMEKKQRQMFQKQRQVKIQTALGALRNKHKGQRQAFTKKTKAGENQLLKDRETQTQRNKLKNTNAMKQLKSQQEKQVLTHKGQLKNRISVSSCKSRSKLFPLRLN